MDDFASRGSRTKAIYQHGRDVLVFLNQYGLSNRLSVSLFTASCGLANHIAAEARASFALARELAERLDR